MPLRGNFMENFIKILSKINKYLCTILLITMVGYVFANTALRYFFDSGIIITEELVRYLFVWGIYLAVISVWFNRGHIRVTTVTDRLTPRNKIKFSLIFEVVSILVLLILAYGSMQYYFDTTTIGQVTGIPYRALIFAVALGAFICSLVSIGHIKQDLQMLKLDDSTLEKMQQEANKEQ